MSGPPLWLVSRGDSSVYLFGQGPWGVKTGDVWFTEPLRQALQCSIEIWHEIPNGARTPDQSLLAEHGLSDIPLSERFDASGFARLVDAAAAVNVDVTGLEGLRPWLASQVLDHALRAQPGLDGLVDVEAELVERARRAGKVVRSEFPDAEALLSTFASLGEVEVEYLAWTVDRVLRGVSWMSQEAAAWLSGDIVVLVDDVNATKEGRPGLYEALFAGRNRRWVPRIDSLLTDRTTAMVVVGMGHLTGDEGVLALLEASGHPVVRVS
jgi:uncharacterized protein YbaP (TraB family)